MCLYFSFVVSYLIRLFLSAEICTSVPSHIWWNCIILKTWVTPLSIFFLNTEAGKCRIKVAVMIKFGIVRDKNSGEMVKKVKDSVLASLCIACTELLLALLLDQGDFCILFALEMNCCTFGEHTACKRTVFFYPSLWLRWKIFSIWMEMSDLLVYRYIWTYKNKEVLSVSY